MNKKMRELKSKIMALREKAGKLFEDGKCDEADEIIEGEIKNLEKQYTVAEKLYKYDQENVTDEKIEDLKKEKSADGYKAIAKMMQNKNLTDVENALVVESESGTDSGVNYLIPQDIQTDIRELRRSYKSAKNLVNVIPVNTLFGSTNFDTEDSSELSDFDDGTEIAESENPKFKKVDWKIKFKGKIIYISNILLGNERASLLSYINKWFVKKAVRTENKDIFKQLINDKEANECKGLLALKSLMNTKLDPGCLIGACIVTNQSGFDEMDKETDEVGRPMLQPNPANSTQKLFNGLPIEVFSDKELKIDGLEKGNPVFVGDLKNGIDFYDRENLEFAISEHYAFNKNLNALRVMEGYDVKQTDKESYLYINFQPKEVVPEA